MVGYMTDFSGHLTLRGPGKNLPRKVINFMHGLNRTQRLARNTDLLAKKCGITRENAIDLFGPQGEFYFPVNEDMDPETILDHNQHPDSQPGYHCGWHIPQGTNRLEWDGKGEFYKSPEWLEYVVGKLAEMGVVANGKIMYKNNYEAGILVVTDNVFREEERDNSSSWSSFVSSSPSPFSPSLPSASSTSPTSKFPR